MAGNEAARNSVSIIERADPIREYEEKDKGQKQKRQADSKIGFTQFTSLSKT